MKSTCLIAIILINFSCSAPKESSEQDLQVEQVQSPSQGNASLPHLIKGDDDNLYMSWVEKRDSNMVDFKYAQLLDNRWSEPDLIASGNNWFVNWADYPMLAVDQDGNKIAHYLAKSTAGTYSYDVNLVLKPDTATNWSDPIIPHKDGTPTEHGFVTMLPQNDGSFLLTWLDGRNTGGGNHEVHGEGVGAMTIRSAVININGNLSEDTEIDGRVCDCCQTGGAMTTEEAIIVYRDRSVDEVRDMAFVTKKGDGWSQSQLVAQDNWNIAGCPVNGPRIASYKNNVAVAWYSGALDRPVVKVAFKTENNFNDPIIIDNTSPIGRVDIAMIDSTTAIVSWLDGGNTPAIKYRKVSQSGKMSPTTTLALMSESRGSGFPQLEVIEGTVYFSWTHLAENTTSIRVVRSTL